VIVRRSGRALHALWRWLQSNSRLRRWIKAGVLLATIGVFVFLVVKSRQELSRYSNWQDYLPACGQSLLLYPLSLVAQAWAWGTMIARLGRVTSGWHDLEIYAYSHLMRRLPGAMWYLAGRTASYRERGIGAGVTLAASGLEWLLLLFVAAALSFGLSLKGHFSWLVSLAALALLVLALSCGLQALASGQERTWLPGFARRWLANLSAAAIPRRTDLALWTAIYTLAYAVGGLILYLLTRRIFPESDLNVLRAISIWSLAGGIGALTSMIIPAGMGIRELTLTALLTPGVPLSGALLIAAVLRLLFIVADLLWGGLMWGLAHILARRQAAAD